ncbi:MAG: glycosyltransferase [Balneolales bacterium]
MRISVAMAVYNGSRYLPSQLESIAKQARLPDQLVVCDDNSNDDSVEIIRKFAQKAPFHVDLYVNEKNLGYSQNFSKAMSLCDGDLIFLSDQDDVWFDHKIGRITEIATQHPKINIFINNAELTDHNLVPAGITKTEQILATGYPIRNMVMGTCSAVRQEFISYCLPVPGNYGGHDNWLHDLAGLLNTRMILNESLQYYRIHRGNTSTYFANTHRKIYRIKRIASDLFSPKDRLSEIKTMHKRRHILMNWLIEHARIPPNISQNTYYLKKIIDDLEIEIMAIEQRIKLYEGGKLSRILPGIKMLVNKQYSYFNGWKSLLKDLLQ